MSYLTLPTGISDFSKAVFSLWFRVPKESVIAASSHSLPTADENFFMMQNVLPILTYGKVQTNANYQLVSANIVHSQPPGENVVVMQPVGYTPHTTYEVDPCFIGLVCRNDGTFNMAFNIQMENKGVYKSLIHFATSLDYVEGSTDASVPGSGFVGIGTGSYKSTIADGSYGIQDAQAEYFYVETHLTPRLEPDAWHHILLSFNVSGSLSLGDKPSSDCRLWYAIDDIDYRGWENLQPFRDEHDDLDENAILTRTIYNESGPFHEDDRLFFNNYIAFPNGAYSPTPIPSSGAAIGLPAASHYVDGIFRVEMAELQIWTGVTLDTEKVSNRRAFVDADGKPVEPIGTEDMPAPAEKLLGKKPEIMLHGSSDWKTGHNTGTLGVEIAPDGTITDLLSGQFKPTGGIEAYKPDPALHETETA